MTTSTLAILGGGPIGIETALLATRQGIDVRVYEADRPGAHVARWGHVEFFSAWHRNWSDWGRETLQREGHQLPAPDDYPTGYQYLERYLWPLCESEALDGCIVSETEVVDVARQSSRKSDHVGSDRSAGGPFVLAVEHDGERRFETAEHVVDATGCYRTPNGLGPGGTRAVGEETYQSKIDYYIPDVLGSDRDRFAGTETLVVGDGYSAATTLRQLLQLRRSTDLDIHWLRDDDETPYTDREDDPLPQRRDLSNFGNRLAADELGGVETHVGTVRRIRRPDDGSGFVVDLMASTPSLSVDRIVANVGYRPDVSLFRELQVDLCWATEGPMDLAASLIGGSGDCLDQTSEGLDALAHPEDDFYIVGSKAYGRNSSFLLQIGHDQAEAVVGAIAP